MQISVKPLQMSKLGGKEVYGIEVHIKNGKQYELWKTLEQYRELQIALDQITFDVDKYFQKGLKKDEKQIGQKVIQFIQFCLSRHDITNTKLFRQFMKLQEIEFDYLDEWSRADVGSPNMKVIDFCWDPSEMILVTLEKQNNSIQKITNFFKTMLSQSNKNGVLKIWRLKNKWQKIHEIPLEADPFGIDWARKSGFLMIGTSIGIYIYCLSVKQTNKIEIIHFIKDYNINSFCFGPKSGVIYYSTDEKIHSYSLSKQFGMELNAKPFIQIGGLGLQKFERRLYVCTGWGLRIYDVSQIKQVKELAKIQGVSCFNKISISEKYLFGLSETGFISVIELRPQGKERLTNTLTNIDCPSSSPFLAFHEKGQILVLAHRNSVILISAKNVALFCGGNHKCRITAGIYDEESNIIGCAGEDGSIIFYNLSMKM